MGNSSFLGNFSSKQDELGLAPLQKDECLFFFLLLPAHILIAGSEMVN